MSNRRCSICGRTGPESTMIFAVFSKDKERRRGHRLCFEDVNRGSRSMQWPWMWEIEETKKADNP